MPAQSVLTSLDGSGCPVARRPILRRGRTAALLCVAMLASLTVMGVATRADAAGTCTVATCAGPGEPTPNPGRPHAVWAFLQNRTQTTIDVSWTIPANATSVKIERSIGSQANWSVLYQHSVTGAITAMTDSGLPPDTAIFYRTTMLNSYGGSDPEITHLFTHALKTQPVLRVQIALTSGPAGADDTSDAVAVSIEGPGDGSGGTTWINPPANHRLTPGATQTYDLPNVQGIRNLEDLESVSIQKPGDDSWCLTNAVLLVNGTAAFSTSFGPSCPPVDQRATILTHNALRADPQWSTVPAPAADGFTFLPGTTTVASITFKLNHVELQQRIEAMVGDKIHATPAYWNPASSSAVTITAVSATSIGVTLDMRADVPYLPNPDVRVSFDLDVSAATNATGSWVVSLAASHAATDVDFPLWLDVADKILPCGPIASIATGSGIPFCVQALSDAISDGVSSQITTGAGGGFNLGHALGVNAGFDGGANLVITETMAKAPAPPKGPVVIRPGTTAAASRLS